MLTRVDVLSENPFFLKIRDALPTDSIIIDKIDGLNPPDIDLFLGDYAQDGGFYGGRRVPPRTVTFTFLLNPNYKLNETTDGLRKMLHKTFYDPFVEEDGLGFRLRDDMLANQIFFGHAEKFDGDVFSDDTTVEIVVRCPDPYLRDEAETVVKLLGTSSPLTYLGTADCGFVATLEVTANTSMLTLGVQPLGSDGAAKGTRRVIQVEYPFLVGDIVKISSLPGNRYITLTRGSGSPVNLLSKKVSSSKWLYLHSARSTIFAQGPTSESSPATIKELRYTARHWGV